MHGFAELNLFVCDSVGELVTLDAAECDRTGRSLTYLSGLIRALAYIHDSTRSLPCSPDGLHAAERWVKQHVHWSTAKMLDYLLVHIAPYRGIDKSPRTLQTRSNLARAIRSCPDAQFVQLVRHPVTFALSFAATRPIPAARQIDALSFALHFWLHSHQSLAQWSTGIPESQFFHVRAEAILSDPRHGLSSLASSLGLQVDDAAVEAMLHPERSPYANTALLPAGSDNDIEFLRNPSLRPAPISPPLEIPSAWQVDSHLAAEVIRVARQFGYE